VERDARGRRLRAALAAVLVRDNAPELRAPSRRRSCSATLAAVDLLAAAASKRTRSPFIAPAPCDCATPAPSD
jgi:hypothetical protein